MAASSREPSAAESLGSEPEDPKKVFRDFYKTYNDMSELCFARCVWDFGTAALRGREERCLNFCADKYFEATKVAGKSFAGSSGSN